MSKGLFVYIRKLFINATPGVCVAVIPTSASQKVWPANGNNWQGVLKLMRQPPSKRSRIQGPKHLLGSRYSYV